MDGQPGNGLFGTLTIRAFLHVLAQSLLKVGQNSRLWTDFGADGKLRIGLNWTAFVGNCR